jgi:hypothetical protein
MNVTWLVAYLQIDFIKDLVKPETGKKDDWKLIKVVLHLCSVIYVHPPVEITKTKLENDLAKNLVRYLWISNTID